MKTINSILLLVVIAIIASCNQNKIAEKQKNIISEEDQALLEKAQSLFQALPDIAADDSNPVTPEKVALGKALYYDKRLSKDENISCNSCHDLETFGVDNKATSPGDDGENGDRNSPTVLNAALHFVQFWDGRAKDVEEQAGGPILEKDEMGIPSKEFLIDRLSAIKEYQDMYAQAYPDQNDPITYENTQYAIGAFERTLLTPAPFDAYLKGDVSKLTEQQKKGLEAFIDNGCTTCHMGVLLGGNMYHKFGVYDEYWKHTKSEKIDEGLFQVTGDEAQKFIFKVPSLRNVEKTFPYYHDGSVTELNEAIKVMAITQLNRELSDQDIAEIGEFLGSLTGEVPNNALMK